MPIIYSAIVPHSPVFLPLVGEPAREKVAATILSLATVSQRLKSLQPETIVVIAPHDESKQNENQYIFHVATTYRANFAEFGDIVTKTEYSTDTVLATQLKDRLTQEGIGVTYISDEKLDYSAGVPLECISQGIQAKIIVIHPPGKNLASLFADGTQIQKVLQETSKPIVCIASADLSHCLSNEAPLPFNAKGKELDNNIVKWLKAKRLKSLCSIQSELLNEVGACGIPSIVLLLGILKQVNHSVKLLSYEDEIGVGHVVVEYTIS